MQILMALILTVFSTAAPDLSGTWSLDMSWPNDAHSTGACTLEQAGERLSGTCGGGDAKFPVTGEVKGNEATWHVEVEQNGHKGKMTFAGVVDEAGTAIKGSVAIADGAKGTFTMKRRQ